MTELDTTFEIIMSVVSCAFVVIRLSLFYQHRIPKAVSVTLLTLFATGFDVLISFGGERIAVYAAIAQTVLTPVIYSLCCSRWLRVSAELYCYNIVFCTLPGVVGVMLLTAAFQSGLINEIVFSGIPVLMSTAFYALTVVAYKRRWLRIIDPRISLAVYIVSFYILRVLTRIFPSIPDSVTYPMGVVITASSVMTLLCVLILPELAEKRAQNERMRAAAAVNDLICRHLVSQNAAARAFRHDIANHLQVLEGSHEPSPRHREQLARIIGGHLSPAVTEDMELNAMLHQLDRLMQDSGRTFTVSWNDPPRKLAADRRSELLDRALELFYDIQINNKRGSVELLADGEDYRLLFRAERDGDAK